MVPPLGRGTDCSKQVDERPVNRCGVNHFATVPDTTKPKTTVLVNWVSEQRRKVSALVPLNADDGIGPQLFGNVLPSVRPPTRERIV